MSPIAHSIPALPVWRVVALSLVMLILMTLTVAAQFDQAKIDAVRRSLVHIEVTGISAADSAPRRSDGTGFLVSADGFILTNYHLLDAMNGADTDTIKFSVSFGENTANGRVKALPIDGNEIIDLLLLKVPERQGAFSPLVLGSAENLTVGTPLFTLGFPRADDPDFQPNAVFRQGDLSSRDGPLGSLWMVSIPISSGQSGSPVFSADGKVVGVAKATSSNDPNSRYMIPIHFADTLLAHLRLASLQTELERVLRILKGLEPEPLPLNERLVSVESNISDLRKVFNWSATLDGDDLRIDFRKLVGGARLLRGIKPYVRPIAYDKNDKSVPMSPFKIAASDGTELIELPITSFDDASFSGTFVLKGIRTKIKNRIDDTANVTSIPEIEVRLVPVLERSDKVEELPNQSLIVKVDIAE